MKTSYKVGVATGILLLGILGISSWAIRNRADDDNIRLTAQTGSNFDKPDLVKNRLALFGYDPLDKGAALSFELNIDTKVTEQPITGQVSLTGNLISGTERMPLRASGETHVIKTTSGHDFHSGVLNGTVTVRGKETPATLFLATIPDEDKYVASLVVQPKSGPGASFAFGESFPEYTDKFRPTALGQANEEK